MSDLFPEFEKIIKQYPSVFILVILIIVLITAICCVCLYLTRKHKRNNQAASETDRRFVFQCGKLLLADGFRNIHILSDDLLQGGGELFAEKEGDRYLIHCVSEDDILNDEVIHELSSEEHFYLYDHIVILSNRAFSEKEISSAYQIGINLWGNRIFCDLEENLADHSL